MEDIRTIIVGFNVEGDDIGHHIREHEETRCLLEGLLTIIDDVENRSQDFIHALYVLDEGGQLGEDEEDTRHVVVPTGLFKFSLDF